MPSYEQFTKNVNKNTKALIIIHMQGLGVGYLDKLKTFVKEKKFT